MSKISCAFNLLMLFLTCATASRSLQRRFASFPKDSAIGYIIALAVPLNGISESVFVAFNFEANYLLPDYESGASSYHIPKDNERKGSTDDNLAEIADIYSSIKKTFTRKNIYASMESQLFSIGFNGTACILKTICQASEIPVYHSNGLLGSLFHIVFTPSTSEDENLPYDVYVAERNGLQNQCSIYDADCPKSMLDHIEQVIDVISNG